MAASIRGKASRFVELSVNDFAKLNSLCFAFEDEWQVAKERPHLGKYLIAAGDSWKPNLLRELVVLDIEYRIRQGETPQPDEYRCDLEGFGTVIGQAFADARARGSMASESMTSAAANAEEPGMGQQIGRYRLDKELGQGGFGTVFLATDTELW